MPRTEVVLFAEDDGTAPVLDWLDSLPEKVQVKVIARIERLAECGHELRRPEADFLRDGMHELRIRYGHSNYRILYFFQEHAAVVSHGMKKEGRVPPQEIDRALERQMRFGADSEKHSYRG